MTLHTIDYGTTTIEYELLHTARKTLGITVHPDKRVTVRAPLGATTADVEAVLRKRGGWIVKKQQGFEKYLPMVPPRRYVSGETHLYLGRRYRLKVIEGQEEGVKLTRGWFYLHVRDTADLERKEELMTEWYRGRAREIFAERLDACYPRAERFGIPYPEMKIRMMKKRWGSCTAEGTVLLNLRLVQVPKACIDYVIVHELAHLKEHHHNRAFYGLLERMMPDWRERREELNRFQVA